MEKFIKIRDGVWVNKDGMSICIKGTNERPNRFRAYILHLGLALIECSCEGEICNYHCADKLAEEFNAAVDRAANSATYCDNCEEAIGAREPKHCIKCMYKKWSSGRIYTDADANEARHLIDKKVEYWSDGWKTGILRRVDEADANQSLFLIKDMFFVSFIREIPEGEV
jgi:hypothetical protein